MFLGPEIAKMKKIPGVACFLILIICFFVLIMMSEVFSTLCNTGLDYVSYHLIVPSSKSEQCL